MVFKFNYRRENMKTFPNQGRQGDILIIDTPESRKFKGDGQIIDREKDNSLVLAHGEKTGHRHRFVSEQVNLIEHQKRRYLVMNAVKNNSEKPSLVHEEHGAIAPEKTDKTFEVRQHAEYSPEEIRRVED